MWPECRRSKNHQKTTKKRPPQRPSRLVENSATTPARRVSTSRAPRECPAAPLATRARFARMRRTHRWGPPRDVRLTRSQNPTEFSPQFSTECSPDADRARPRSTRRPARRAPANKGISTELQRNFNGTSTEVQRIFNGTSTDVGHTPVALRAAPRSPRGTLRPTPDVRYADVGVFVYSSLRCVFKSSASSASLASLRAERERKRERESPRVSPREQTRARSDSDVGQCSEIARDPRECVCPTVGFSSRSLSPPLQRTCNVQTLAKGPRRRRRARARERRPPLCGAPVALIRTLSNVFVRDLFAHAQSSTEVYTRTRPCAASVTCSTVTAA